MSQPNSELTGCQSYAIFWDIENCPIPPHENRASNVIQKIKQFIATKYESRVGQQSEPCTFICSCDTKLLDKTHVEALNRSGVDILHVNPIRALNGMSTPMAYKVNADSKLIECIHKYVDHHFNQKKCLVFVITGDIDFAPAIRAAKRRGFEVILLYGTNTSQEMKNCATESHSYNEIVSVDTNPLRCMFTEGNVMTPNPATSGASSLCTIAPATISQLPSTGSAIKALSDRSASNTQSTRAKNESSLPFFIEQAQGNVRNFQNESAKVRPKTTQQTNDIELNPELVKTIQEVAQVERHIALRVLQSTRGDVNLAINLLVSD